MSHNIRPCPFWNQSSGQRWLGWLGHAGIRWGVLDAKLRLVEMMWLSWDHGFPKCYEDWSYHWFSWCCRFPAWSSCNMLPSWHACFLQYTQIRSSYFSQNMLLFDGFVGPYFQNLQDFFTGNHYDYTHGWTMMNLECKDYYFEQVTSVRSQHTRPCAQLWRELCRVGSGLSVAGRVVCRIVTPTSRVCCHQTSSNQQIDLGKPANHQIRNVASPVSSLCQVGKRGFSASTWGLSLSACCCDTKRCEFAARTPAKKIAGLMMTYGSP